MRTWADLTESFPFKFSVDAMKADLASIDEGRLLDHYDPTLDRGWRAAMLVSRHGSLDGREAQRPSWNFHEFRRTPLVDELPYFREVLDFLDEHEVKQGRIRLLKLEPGAGIAIHRDIGAEVACLAFNQVRLHVPIITNPHVTFFVGGEKIKMQPGRLYYVNFSKKHYVRNEGSQARYHFVMDLRVNEWLRSIFPPTTAWEELEFAAFRATAPFFWRARRAMIQFHIKAWNAYRGSLAQAVVHRLKGRSA